MDLGSRLRQFREAAKFSRVDLARKVGLAPGSIRKIKEADVNGPNFPNGLLLSRALGVWPDEIAFVRPFSSDVSIQHENLQIEMRIRVRGSGSHAHRHIVGLLREFLSTVAEVQGASDERLNAIETELTELRDRMTEALAEVARMKRP